MSRSWTLAYDADSNLTNVTTPSGGTITYGYNALGQQTSTSYGDGTPGVSVSYDADGNTASMTDGTGTTDYTYDALDQLTETSNGTNEFSYTYDADGRVASRTIPDGTTTSYTYDNDGNLATATTGSDTTIYSYDPAGNLTQTTLPNGVVETRTYDDVGRLSQLDDGFRTFAYAYDTAGNLTSRTVGGVTDTYSYDTLDRLTGISGGTTITYGYDAVGNRTSMTDSTGTTTYTYDVADQLQTAIGPNGTTNYGFDQNGNETSAGPWNYTVNLAGQLTTANDGTTTVDYSYDGNSNRRSSTTDGTTTNQLWDTNNLLPELAQETDSSGGLIRGYTYGSSVISMTTPSATAYYSSDATGSITEMSSASGASLGQYDRNPFGDGATSAGVDASVAGNRIGLGGEYQDPTTGLYDLRARQYDPATSRFTTRDPLGPQNAASAYTYVADNPLTYTDPSGEKRTNTCSGLWCYTKCILTTHRVVLLAVGAVLLTGGVGLAGFGIGLEVGLFADLAPAEESGIFGLEDAFGFDHGAWLIAAGGAVMGAVGGTAVVESSQC